MPPAGAEGGLWSCVEDLATWLSFQLRAHRDLPAPSPVLSAASLRLMHRPRYLAGDGWAEVMSIHHEPAVLDPHTRLAWKYFPSGGGAIHTPFTGGINRTGFVVWEVKGCDPTFTPSLYFSDYSSPTFGAGHITISDPSASGRIEYASDALSFLSPAWVAPLNVAELVASSTRILWLGLTRPSLVPW